MPDIISISDFLGSHNFPQDQFSETNDYNPILAERQLELIYKVMGAELGQLFIDDLDANGVPVTARFQDLYNAFVMQDSCDKIVESKGVKFMILGYVYYFLVKEGNARVTLTGNKQVKGENSEANQNVGFMARRYNDSIATGKAIQWFICENSTVYPEYKGVELNYNSIY